MNQFEHLDAQDETSRLAQVGPTEQDPAEFDAWQAEVNRRVYAGELEATDADGVQTMQDVG